MVRIDWRGDPNWVEAATSALESDGCCVVVGVLDGEQLADLRERMYAVRSAIDLDVPEELRARSGEVGVLRVPAAYDEYFLRLLELEPVLAIVDAALSPTAVLHVQNGFILPPAPPSSNGNVQGLFHQDFPRFLNGYRASVNTLLAVDEFTAENGGTIVVPGTHQLAERPSDTDLANAARPVECPAGSAIVFDSTLWHAAGRNTSSRDRLGVNLQFTRSFMKQQIDYVRALGDEVVERQPPRTQQLLGWYTRVPTSIDEYYLPADRRLYRSGQG
jgi:ectoine hydroxylase-related dioxygenase (phytanoyl-CoA dioxygenase family)